VISDSLSKSIDVGMKLDYSDIRMTHEKLIDTVKEVLSPDVTQR
jgi:hypothetical protein